MVGFRQKGANRTVKQDWKEEKNNKSGNALEAFLLSSTIEIEGEAESSSAPVDVTSPLSGERTRKSFEEKKDPESRRNASFLSIHCV